MMSKLPFQILIALAQVVVAAYYYDRVLGQGLRFRRFLLFPGLLLLGFQIAYFLHPEWYFLSSEAEPHASVATALLEATAVVASLRISTKRPLSEAIFFVSLRALIMVVSSLLPFAVFALFAGDSVAYLVAAQWNDLLFSAVSAVLDMGLLIAAAEAVARYVRCQTVELRWGQFMPVIGAQAVSLLLISALQQDGGQYARTLAELAVLLVIYVIADAVLLTALRAMAKNSELERDVTNLLQQQTMQKEYYLSLHEKLQTVRRMRHDYRNTLETIDALLASGEATKALHFAEESQSVLDPGGLSIYTGNEILDAVLNNKAERARQAHIDFSLQLTLPRPLRIADTDLMSIFGNLLDNAIEYVAGLPEQAVRSIEIWDSIHAGFWTIRFVNSYAGTEIPTFLTTKADEKLHGQGMGIVRSIAGRYDGAMHANVDNGKLTIAITLSVANMK